MGRRENRRNQRATEIALIAAALNLVASIINLITRLVERLGAR